MNASTRTNNLIASLKTAARRAVASRAFGMLFAILFFVALCYAFSLFAQLCIATLGETLGLLVYFVLCFGVIYVIEVYSNRVLRR